MASQSVTFDLDATPEAVWHVVGERWGEADRTLPFVTDCRVVDGSDGGPRPGTTREVTFAERVAGADEATERLVAWHSPRSFAYETVTPTFPVSRLAWEWRVDPRGEVRSRLTVTPTVEVWGGTLTGWLADSMLNDVVETLAEGRARMRATVERAARERAD